MCSTRNRRWVKKKRGCFATFLLPCPFPLSTILPTMSILHLSYPVNCMDGISQSFMTTARDQLPILKPRVMLANMHALELISCVFHRGWYMPECIPPDAILNISNYVPSVTIWHHVPETWSIKVGTMPVDSNTLIVWVVSVTPEHFLEWTRHLGFTTFLLL